jgi:hypothetical protein
MTAGCDHRPSDDPRFKNTCRKCGQPLARPEAAEPLLRSLEFERGVTQQASKGYVDPSDLIAHAEHRAQTLCGEYVRDPMHILPGRNRRRDVREELADARNHLLWDSQEHLEDEERAHENLYVLRLIVMAYDRLVER